MLRKRRLETNFKYCKNSLASKQSLNQTTNRLRYVGVYLPDGSSNEATKANNQQKLHSRFLNHTLDLTGNLVIVTSNEKIVPQDNSKLLAVYEFSKKGLRLADATSVNYDTAINQKNTRPRTVLNLLNTVSSISVL